MVRHQYAAGMITHQETLHHVAHSRVEADQLGIQVVRGLLALPRQGELCLGHHTRCLRRSGLFEASQIAHAEHHHPGNSQLGQQAHRDERQYFSVPLTENIIERQGGIDEQRVVRNAVRYDQADLAVEQASLVDDFAIARRKPLLEALVLPI